MGPNTDFWRLPASRYATCESRAAAKRLLMSQRCEQFWSSFQKTPLRMARLCKRDLGWAARVTSNPKRQICGLPCIDWISDRLDICEPQRCDRDIFLFCEFTSGLLNISYCVTRAVTNINKKRQSPQKQADSTMLSSFQPFCQPFYR
ncbi:uncharacterized protein TERG_11799 [Trichophyton rubrum CBS 118892]|uniref:Uncharacterized protein n=1 Tax=Trichophyton rubrum (strain ATCC MYA-4607 / CBS 118892) TaxID=559305 RepID=A0A080WRI4_TRIRC|nr:uncharacterized protein TERG_11799 [Trichophyton rubrum CBS 118892]KFL60778.1 hypothetical protein TERG_11799 [Trichophyton rubrum CBS 118892]